MTIRRISAIVFCVGIAAILGWDLVPAFTPTRGDTVSEWLRDVFARYPSLVYLGGIFIGHLALPSKRGPKPAWSMFLAFGTAAALLAFDVWVATWPVHWTAQPMALVSGILCGWWFWPQAPGPRGVESGGESA